MAWKALNLVRVAQLESGMISTTLVSFEELSDLVKEQNDMCKKFK